MEKFKIARDKIKDSGEIPADICFIRNGEEVRYKWIQIDELHEKSLGF